MIVSLSAAALLGIFVLVLPELGPEGEILGSTGVFGAFSLVALMCATVMERRRLVPLMWVGINCAAAAGLVWLVMIWFERSIGYKVEEKLAQTGGSFTVASVLIAQCGLLSLPRFDHHHANTVRTVTISVSALFGAYVLALIWWFDHIERLIDDDALLRGLGVLAILTACGTVITPILWKVQSVRRVATSESIPLKVKVQVTCPRCHTSQHMSAGPAKCSQCGLRITLDVEEPRCVCGYLLHRLESDRCPECGRLVPESDRWAADKTPGVFSGD
jgi:hypothetical protein